MESVYKLQNLVGKKSLPEEQYFTEILYFALLL